MRDSCIQVWDVTMECSQTTTSPVFLYIAEYVQNRWVPVYDLGSSGNWHTLRIASIQLFPTDSCK